MGTVLAVPACTCVPVETPKTRVPATPGSEEESEEEEKLEEHVSSQPKYTLPRFGGISETPVRLRKVQMS